MIPFVAKYPSLFHVTRRSALPGIGRLGLLAASAFDGDNEPPNRVVWTPRAGLEGEPVWLRWQRLPDQSLARRLPPSVSPAQWRAFINGMAFLFASLTNAERLRSAGVDRHVDQVIIRWDTDTLVRAGADLRCCRWNNGFLDRSNPVRIRSFDDYRPVALWKKGDVVQEVTVAGGIKAGIPFRIMPLP